MNTSPTCDKPHTPPPVDRPAVNKHARQSEGAASDWTQNVTRTMGLVCWCDARWERQSETSLRIISDDVLCFPRIFCFRPETSTTATNTTSTTFSTANSTTTLLVIRSGHKQYSCPGDDDNYYNNNDNYESL